MRTAFFTHLRRRRPRQPMYPWVVPALMVAVVIVAPQLAHAQGVTGANGGFIAPVINWFMTNFVGGLIEIGVIVGGVILMFMRLHLAGLATMIVGSLIVTNYEALAALL
jgi:hypothetical protein